jgi:hypothetical protein
MTAATPGDPRAGPPNERGPTGRAPGEAVKDDNRPRQNTTFAYSRGASKFDAYPVQRSAASWGEFQGAVLKDRASKGLTYVCAPFKANGDGRHHRCALSAANCRGPIEAGVCLHSPMSSADVIRGKLPRPH